MEFRYDNSTGILELIVQNTTPQVPGEANPVITDVYFNLPAHTDTNISLLDQSAAGGLPATFLMLVDEEQFVHPHINRADGFGAFSVGLYAFAVYGGIANPEATEWALPTGSQAIGPVTFRFSVTGSDAAHLNAADFALSPSAIPPGERIGSGVLKFQAGGVGGQGSAFIGTQGGCAPGLWFSGQPCEGETIEFVLGSAGGCAGCLIMSSDPTPFPFLGLFEVPISPPYRAIWVGTTASAAQAVPLNIPAGFEDFEGFFTLAEFDPNSGEILFSPVVSFVVCK
jgi:hypothetical protein